MCMLQLCPQSEACMTCFSRSDSGRCNGRLQGACATPAVRTTPADCGALALSYSTHPRLCMLSSWLCMLAEFMELMEFRFHEKARQNGCFIVSAAGFDSVPADLGVLFTMQQFRPPALPSSVTSFLTFQMGPAGACGKPSFGAA